jgi:hypothetical protein
MSFIGAATFRSTAPSATGPSESSYSNSAGGFTLPAGQNWRDDAMVTLWSYTVPEDFELIADRLIIHPAAGGNWSMSTSVTVEKQLDYGTVKVLVDGSAVYEERLRARAMHEAVTGLASMIGPWSAPFGQEQVVCYGDGIQLTTGQVLSGTWDVVANEDGVIPHVVRIHVYAKRTDTGAPLFLGGTLRVADNGSAQSVFSYTVPAHGITIMSITTVADAQPGPMIANWVQLHLDTELIAELGGLWSGCRRSVHEPLVFQFGGIALEQGQRLDIVGAPWMDAGGAVSAVIVGTLTNVAAPIIKITSTPVVSSTDTTPDFSFTISEGTAEYDVDGGGYSAASSPLALGPLALGAHTLTIRSVEQPTFSQAFTWTIAAAVDTTDPVISNVTPTPGVAPGEPGGFPLDPYEASQTPIECDVTDASPGLRLVAMWGQIGLRDSGESTPTYVVHNGLRFVWPFDSDASERTTISGGYHYVILPRGGWPPGSVSLTVEAVDQAGNLEGA